MRDGKLDAVIGGLAKWDRDGVILNLWRAGAGVHKLQLVNLQAVQRCEALKSPELNQTAVVALRRDRVCCKCQVIHEEGVYTSMPVDIEQPEDMT